MGRSSSCDIKLSDERISSRHLAIKLNPAGRVIIKDLDSTNGTFLNGSQIQEAYLMIQDELLIGGVSIWLDEGQLSVKEKRVLVRPDSPTQMKFINLQGGEPEVATAMRAARDLAKPKAAKKPLPEKKPAEPPPSVEFTPEEYDQEEEQEVAEPSVSEINESRLRERILKASQEKGKKAEIAEFSSEEQFDLDASSGNTQFIKIGKDKERPTEKKKRVVKASQPKKKQAKEEGLVDKLFSFMKKKPKASK